MIDLKDQLIEDQKALLKKRKDGYCASRLRAFIIAQATLFSDLNEAKSYLKAMNKFLEKQILNH